MTKDQDQEEETMSKSFSEWIGERRRVAMLPSGIEVEVRRPSSIKMASMGPLPGIETVGDVKRQAEVSRRYVEACLIRMGEERDPIDRGLVCPDDFSFDDLNAIVDAVVELMGIPKKAEGEDGAPLADMASPPPPPASSTE